MNIRVELLTDDELARSFRTFTPAPHQPNIRASMQVIDGELVAESSDPDLVAYLHQVIAAAADSDGALQLAGHHTSKKVGGATLNKHYPGDRVKADDSRYPYAVVRALCFVGENDPACRYQDRVLHAFIDHE